MDKTLHGPRLAVLCALLRQKRLDAGLTQEQLAERLDEPQSFISKVEGGERRVDLIELEQICSALRVNLSTFVREYQAR